MAYETARLEIGPCAFVGGQFRRLVTLLENAGLMLHSATYTADGSACLGRQNSRVTGLSAVRESFKSRSVLVFTASKAARMSDEPTDQFSEREALLFHSEGRPGKIEIIASKPMATQRDLALAYSPGVAVPVLAIADDPATAYDYTAKGNLCLLYTSPSPRDS